MIRKFAPQVADKRFDRANGKPARAGIKPDGKTVTTGLDLHGNQRVDHRQRQVVDRLDATILKDVESCRQARPRGAGYKDQSWCLVIHDQTIAISEPPQQS